MTLDFSYQPGPAPEVVAEIEAKGRVVETWAIEGSAGDRVLVDAHIPDHIERIVVMAHGADNSRKARYIEVSAKSFARSGMAVVGMDAPYHGDREGAGNLEDPIGTLVDLMVQSVRDHRRLLDAVAERWPGVPVGFAGFSMGGLHGVPLVAVEQRIGSAAIVLAGSTRVSYPARFGRLDPATAAALELTDPAVHAPAVADRPVLLLNADHDEVVPRQAGMALYDALTGPKEIVFMPGTHIEWGHAARWYRRLEGFFRETLR